ncbi:MAG: deoxyribose-phosphate aldolase [Bacilli bacterium]|nr:deoxyribose-phosphate aldolase [Bacilli bacterium]
MEINRMIDHTLLKPDASIEAIKKLCEEARSYEFASVCVNPCFVPVASKLLAGSIVKVCTVIGFPLGATLPEVKKFEASEAVKAGAQEIDMVLNISMAKEHDYDFIEKEVRLVKEGCGGKLLKVILETCLLTDEEIVECCRACVRAGADYVKTSTGFSKGGATVRHVAMMREAVGPTFGVKASGGIHNRFEAEDMINAGASRIGASCGVKIVKGE